MKSQTMQGMRTLLQDGLTTFLLPALTFLHKSKIAHCDIKGENIMGVLKDTMGNIVSTASFALTKYLVLDPIYLSKQEWISPC